MFTIPEESDIIKYGIGALAQDVLTVIFFFRTDKVLDS